MSENNLEKPKSRPWYLGWRGAAAVVGAFLLLFMMMPSKEKLAAQNAEKVFEFCMEQGREDDDEEPSKYEISACECVQDTAEKKLLEGAQKEEFDGAWYMSTLLVCTQYNPALLKDFEDAKAATEQRFKELEEEFPGINQRIDESLKQKGGQAKSSNNQPSKNRNEPRQGGVDLFARIEQGDYVWSQSFPKDDALFGFGVAVRRAIDYQCPGAISGRETADIETFLGGLRGAETIDILHGRKPLDLEALMERSILDVAYAEGARRRVQQLVEAEGCNGRRVRAVSANVSRMLSGRRPATGASAGRTSLVVEKVSPIQQKHSYRNKSGAALTSRGAAQLDKDFEEARKGGLKILECHYDENPNDEWYEVQYYWAVSTLTTLGYLIPNFAESFQRAGQERLRKANGRPYTHPVTTYGSPRLECPAFKDPVLDNKRIYAPRKAVSPDAGNVPVPTEPKITEKRSSVTYDYGPAPEDFVPPIPNEIPSQTLYLTMEKQGAGALKTIEIHSFGWWSLPRTYSDYRNRPAAEEALWEDFGAIAKQNPRVLVCKYLAERRGIVKVSRHWFNDTPDGLDRDYLRGRIGDHPVLVIRDERETCPARYQEP